MQETQELNGGGYECPACGYTKQSVIRTTGFPSYVQRKRECLQCGHIHLTVEMRVNMLAILENAHYITKQYEQKNNS